MNRARGLALWLALLVAVGAAACGDDASEPAPPNNVPDTPAAPTSTPAGRNAGVARPPNAIATSGGQSVPLGIGTYCWDEPGSAGICLDAAGPVTTMQTLTVPTGAQISISNPAPARTLREVALTYSPATGTPTTTNAGQLWVWNFPAVGGGQLTSTLSGGVVQFHAALPPGQYVVTIGLFFTQGDVSYGLLLNVR